MSWTAVVPLKGRAARKSRLASVLDDADRVALSESMADHVLARLEGCAAVGEVMLLSPEPPLRSNLAWLRDGGRGLNAELDLVRGDRLMGDLLIIHADLPLLAVEDVDALVAAGALRGVALAPDRHGLGTNALALAAGRAFTFAFGPDSFARHRARAPYASVIDRPGLRWDVDTPNDLASVGPAWGRRARHDVGEQW